MPTQSNSTSRNNIKLHPKNYTPKLHPLGCNSKILAKALDLHNRGWRLFLRNIKGRTYLYARKYDANSKKKVQKYVGKADEHIIKELSRLGVFSNTIITTTNVPRKKPRESAPEGGVGGSFTGVSFMVHRLGLRFVRPWVSPLFLQQLGASFVGRSKQWVLRFGVGFGRFVTLQVNRDGTAQVWLEASDSPLTVDEFIGFCRFYLLELFARVTGRNVDLGDFVVMVAPEVNSDFDGAIMEGVKSLTLKDYYDEVVRVYYSGPGRKATMPSGGVRVEVKAESWKGHDLRDVVDGVVAMARLPVVLTDIKRDLELIKGSLPKEKLEASLLADAVASKLANLLYLSMEKWGNRFELALKDLSAKMQEVLQPIVDRIRELEQENEELKRRLSQFREDNGMKFDELPAELKEFLREMERDGYVRLTETRIQYGDRVWAAIFRFKGNIDAWLEEMSYAYLGRKDNRGLFKAVIKAIRFYDNKWNGKPGVPYDKFLSALQRFI